MIEFKYNKKGELEAREDDKMIGKMNQTPKWLFPNAFKDEDKHNIEQEEVNKEKFIYVYIFDRHFNFEQSYFPEWRIKEIEQSSYSLEQSDKNNVWLALNYAVRDLFNISLEELNPRKNESGKLLLDKYYVSLSHSGGRYAVALSSHNVGVDIQKISEGRSRVLNRESSIWSKKEKEILFQNKDEFLFEFKLWTAKEAVYKYLDPKIEFNEDTKHLIDSSKYLSKIYTYDYDYKYAYVSVCSDLVEEGIEPKFIVK